MNNKYAIKIILVLCILFQHITTAFHSSVISDEVNKKQINNEHNKNPDILKDLLEKLLKDYKVSKTDVLQDNILNDDQNKFDKLLTIESESYKIILIVAIIFVLLFMIFEICSIEERKKNIIKNIKSKFIECVKKRDINGMKLLIDIDTDGLIDDNYVLLHSALRYRYTNTKYCDMNKALQICLENEHVDVANFLLDNGANMDYVDQSKISQLMKVYLKTYLSKKYEYKGDTKNKNELKKDNEELREKLDNLQKQLDDVKQIAK